MARKRYSVEQIVAAVKAHENGTLIGDICRKMGISEATLYRWKKGYGGLEPDQVRELKQLREENERLKKRVAELSLDKSMLRIRPDHQHNLSKLRGYCARPDA